MDNVSALFTASIVQLEKPDAKVVFQIGSLVGLAREELAKKAVVDGAEWMLFIDSDMTFPPYTLRYMLDVAEKNNLDFLTSVCYMRRQPYTPGLFKKFELLEDLSSNSEMYEEVPPKGLFEVEACGLACALVKTKVIMDVVEKFGFAFTMLGPTGEDLSFCWKARACGYKLYADPALKIGHVSQFVVTRDTYEAMRK